MTRFLPTLCSVAVALWGYQTGLWILALPMILAVEARWLLTKRWPAPSPRRLYRCLMLMLAFSFVRALGGQAAYEWFQSWPIGFFPVLLFQLYCVNFSILGRHRALNLRVPSSEYITVASFLAVCIIGASAANGNEIIFLSMTAALFSSLLIVLNQRRFPLGLSQGLIAIALVLALVSGHYLQQLQGHVEAATDPFFNEFNGDSTDPYQTVTRVGTISPLRLSNEILFRVAPTLPDQEGRSPLFPMKIREASYNRYEEGVWGAVNTEFFPIFAADQTLKRWQLSQDAKPTASIRISDRVRMWNGVLKLPMGSSAVHHLPAHLLEQNPLGAVKIHSRPRWVNYEAQFTPQRSFDSAPTSEDLLVPDDETPALETILQQLQVAQQSEQEKVLALQQFFRQNFHYSLELRPPQSGQTGIASFLLNHRSGHCEYFASATTLLLRQAGIPARYVVGYSAYEYSPLERQYVVRQRHAHAWVIAYLQGQWREIDTTPPDWTSLDDAREREWLGDWMAYAGYRMTQMLQDFNPLVVLTLVVLGLLYGLWRRYRQPKRRIEAKPVPVVMTAILVTTPGEDSEFYQLEKQLAVLLPRAAHESLAQWLDRLQPLLAEPQIQLLRQITDLHYRYRFDPDGLSLSEREQLTALCQSLSASLQTQTPQPV